MCILIRSSGDSHAHSYLGSFCLGNRKFLWESVSAFPGCGDGFLFPAFLLSSMRASPFQVYLLALWNHTFIPPLCFWLMLHMRMCPTSTRVICYFLQKSPEPRESETRQKQSSSWPKAFCSGTKGQWVKAALPRDRASRASFKWLKMKKKKKCYWGL